MNEELNSILFREWFRIIWIETMAQPSDWYQSRVVKLVLPIYYFQAWFLFSLSLNPFLLRRHFDSLFRSWTWTENWLVFENVYLVRNPYAWLHFY